jgi:hypothetical protein
MHTSAVKQVCPVESSRVAQVARLVAVGGVVWNGKAYLSAENFKIL